MLNPELLRIQKMLNALLLRMADLLHPVYDFRQTDPDSEVLYLKSYYRGCRYATELLKILPQKPNDILVAQLSSNIATLGSIHITKTPVSSG